MSELTKIVVLNKISVNSYIVPKKIVSLQRDLCSNVHYCNGDYYS